MRALLIALGAGIGAPARYLIDKEVKKIHRSLIPLETHHLFDHKHRAKAWVYLALTLILGVGAAAIGVKLTS